MKAFLKNWFLHTSLILFVSICGCAGMKHDITHNAAYTNATNYVVGQEYRLKQAVFVETLSSRLVLTHEGGLDEGPYTVEEYDKGDKRKWPEVAGVLRVGIRLRLARLQLERSFEMGDMIWVQAEVMDGQLTGKMVELCFISKKELRNIQKDVVASVPLVDSAFLEPVTVITPQTGSSNESGQRQ